MKLKLIAAAVALAASSQASASILGPIEDAGNGLSEAMLNVWDPTTQTSYTQDLGLTWNEMLSNFSNAAYTNSWSIDAGVFADALGGSDVSNLVWNFSVASAQDAIGYTNFETFGVIGTSLNESPINSSALDSAITAHSTLATAVKSVAPAGDDDHALNLAYSGNTATGTYSGSSSIWGPNYKSTPINNTAGIGTDMSLWYWQTGGFSPDPLLTESALMASFDGSTLTLAAPSAVPVPAAVWLFGSGLLGLVGVARRKKA
jgi:hypothetical protein